MLLQLGKIGNQTTVMRLKMNPTVEETSQDPMRPHLRPAPGQLSEAEKQELRQLRERDAEVRNHEKAHEMAAGELAVATEYETVIGPDGQAYATGGGVHIDVSLRLDDPEEAAKKIARIEQAAFAAGAPSAQDRAVVTEARSAQSTELDFFA